MMNLRSPEGLLKATLDNLIVGEMLRNTRGRWRPSVFKGVTDNVYEFDGDYTFTLGCHKGEIMLYVWKGDILTNGEVR